MDRSVYERLTDLREALCPENINRLFRNLHLGEEIREDAPESNSSETGFTAYEEHRYFEMTIQTAKHTRIQIGPSYYDLTPGQFCVIPPGVPHRMKWGSAADPTAGMIWISITGELVRTGYTMYEGSDRSKVWGTDLTLPGSFLMEEIFRERDKRREGSALAITSYVKAFLSFIIQNVNFDNESAGTRWTHSMAEDMQQYIQEHIRDNVSLAELSARASLSPNYLCRIFKDITGETITHYSRRVKVERAAQLLREEVLSVGEIAEALGFCDQFYFSKVFKSFMSVSPQQYRRSLRA